MGGGWRACGAGNKDENGQSLFWGFRRENVPFLHFSLYTSSQLHAPLGRKSDNSHIFPPSPPPQYTMRDVIYAYHLPPCVPSPSFKSRRILAARANRIGNLQRQFTLRINRVFFQLSSGVISVYLRMGPFFSFSILLAHHVTHAYTSKHTLAKSSSGHFIWRIILWDIKNVMLP